MKKTIIGFYPLLFFLAAQLISSTAMHIISPVLSIYVRNLGFSIQELGIISAASALALIIFEPFWGILVDKVTAKRVYTMSALLNPLVMFSYTLVRDLTTFSAIRFFQGIWMCANGVSSRVLVRSSISKGERAFGTLYMVQAVGMLIGPVIGGYAATVASYNSSFYVATVVALIAFFFSLGAPARRRSNNVERIEGINMREKGVLLMTSFLIVLPSFLSTVYMTFMPVFVKETSKFLLNPIEIGMIFTILGIVEFFAPIFFGELFDKIGRIKIIILGMILPALSFLLLPVSVGISMLCLTAVMLGLGTGAVNTSMIVLLTDKIPSSKQGFALGTYGSGEDVGTLIGPLIIGFVYQNYGPELSFYLTAGLMFFNTILSIFLLNKLEFNGIEGMKNTTRLETVNENHLITRYLS